MRLIVLSKTHACASSEVLGPRRPTFKRMHALCYLSDNYDVFSGPTWPTLGSVRLDPSFTMSIRAHPKMSTKLDL